MIEFNEPTISNEITMTPADHEIFLSFTEDVDAEIFHNWWLETGLKQFKQYWTNQQNEELI